VIKLFAGSCFSAKSFEVSALKRNNFAHDDGICATHIFKAQFVLVVAHRAHPVEVEWSGVEPVWGPVGRWGMQGLAHAVPCLGE
jgi:hypothetical protein